MKKFQPTCFNLIITWFQNWSQKRFLWKTLHFFFFHVLSWMRLSCVEPIIAMAFCIHKNDNDACAPNWNLLATNRTTDNFLSTKIRHLSIILPSLYKSAGNLSPSISNPQSKNSAIMKEVGLTAKHDFVFIKSEYKIVKVNFDDIFL